MTIKDASPRKSSTDFAMACQKLQKNKGGKKEGNGYANQPVFVYVVLLSHVKAV